MATIDKDKVEARLRERAEEIARQRASIRAEDEGTRSGELSDYDQHPADQGTDTHDQELDAGTELMLEAQAEQVELALRRLAEGTYGTCIDCGNEIPAARLEAMPEAIRCVEHQEQYEALHRARSGPSRSGP
ncbi:MAG: DnaK suppressor protein [Thermoleophilaceae bacterium]|nr:DnaK suppressor protein [Thermoleophilaceae bacterium]